MTIKTNNRLKNSFFLIPFILMCLNFCSCLNHKCTTVPNKYFLLTEDEKSKIPYDGSKGLKFVSDSGDTIFQQIIGGRQHDFHYMGCNSYNNDCPCSNEYGETIGLEYAGNKLKANMYIGADYDFE